jgi:hypothetical protein
LFSLFLSTVLSLDAQATAVPISASALSGQQILDKVTTVWQSRPEPPFEAFTMPCHELLHQGAEGSCGASRFMRVYMRASDGMAHVETIPAPGEKPVVLLPEGRLYGPAFAPLGFTRKLGDNKRVGSLATDPLSSLKTIASVTATSYAYDVTVSPGSCDGGAGYALSLTPRATDGSHPLRALLVDSASYRICQLTYVLQFNGGSATVQYDFSYEGQPATPVIVRIDAQVPYRSLLGLRSSNTSEDLTDIAFPLKVSGFP